MHTTSSPALRPLQPRLFEFGIAVCRWTHGLPRNPAGVNIAQQAVRSAMSATANHAEARGAESVRDFVHKLQLCLKELRETAVWLEAAIRLGYDGAESSRLSTECDELTAIFVASVKTLKSRHP
jgi:four helix bundle protein